MSNGHHSKLASAATALPVWNSTMRVSFILMSHSRFPFLPSATYRYRSFGQLRFAPSARGLRARRFLPPLFVRLDRALRATHERTASVGGEMRKKLLMSTSLRCGQGGHVIRISQKCFPADEILMDHPVPRQKFGDIVDLMEICTLPNRLISLMSRDGYGGGIPRC